MNKPEMLWIDLETTGLDSRLDVPLELGFCLTDRWGKPIAAISTLVWEESIDFQAGVERGKQLDFVREMHEKSGLWHDLLRQKVKSRDRAADDAVAWLKSQGVEPGTMPLSGNSIGSLDRPFVQNHFPRLNDFLHYRNIDISSIKEVCKLVNPELFKNLEPIIGTKTDATHRVMDDIKASIREYQTYIEEFLLVGES